jgi:prolipoprotein diacylglyceryltransferase
MKKSNQLIRWAPRILCIFMILFISMFALDAFAPELTLWQQIGGFLIHLIPSYILIVALVIAWKREYIGGWIFTVLGILFSIAVFLINFNRNHFSAGQSLINMLIVAIPFIAVGLLFLWSYQVKKVGSK